MELFLRHPNQWLDDEAFYGPGGRDAWSARIRDCRKAPWRMQIENRLIRHPAGHVVSQYKYVPPAAPVQAELWERSA